MTTTLDRNEVQEKYGLLGALANKVADHDKHFDRVEERMDRLEERVVQKLEPAQLAATLLSGSVHYD